MNRFPILHSGFIAKIDTNLKKSQYISNPFTENLLFGQTGDNRYANLFYSEEVDTLYKQFQADRNILRDFETRERILKLSAMMFGKTGLADWLDIQNKYAKVTFPHLEFIVDTINFISTGNRQTSIAIWENLVTYTPNGSNYSLEQHEELRNSIRKNKDAVNFSTSALLSAWVSHRGGYEDLLYTLWLIFGSKVLAIHTTLQRAGA